MKLLTVPNWSFGRDKALLRTFRDILETHGLEIHFLESDVDHNRTVSAFSGEAELVRKGLMALCEEALPCIDLNRHVGVHPRIGGLDVCPFLPYDQSSPPEEVNHWIDETASEFADRFEIPVLLYEKSEKGRHSRQLPHLRKGGFGSLLDREIESDFGPRMAHSRLGVTVMGWRPFLIALNVNMMEGESSVIAANLAARIRTRRRDGDELFRGVRALGFYLSAQNRSQLSMNLTLPDLTPVDTILQWAFDSSRRLGVADSRAELIGVIRAKDMEHTTLLEVKPEQVVEIR